MSRHWCAHCRQLTPTTATPNEVEGFFISDNKIEGNPVLNPGEDADDWIHRLGTRAGQCPHCGLITPDDKEMD